jgi:dipeptidyl aminopeptidase/acylaminoacyl peptidase
MTTTLIPRDVLFGNPERVQPKISPDGTRLAYIAPVDGVLNVWVGSIGGNDFKAITDDRDRGIRSYFWAYDNQHLLYVQDKGGDENWRLYDVDLATGATRDLTPFEGVQVQVIDVDKNFPDSVLVGINKDNPQLHDVYRLTLSTGDLTKLAENPGFVGWVSDAEQKLRGALAPTPEGGFLVLARDTEEAEWQPVVTFGSDDALTSGPAGFTLDGESMYLLSSVDANSSRLVKRHLATGEETVIASDPKFDIAGAHAHPDTREIQMVAFLRERLEWEAIDPEVTDDLKHLLAIDPGEFNLVGRDASDKVWLAAYDHDNGPVTYYAFNRETKEATFLFNHRPELESYDLAEMKPFSYTARDGLTVHGYLTFPAGVEPKNLPTVLNVHGGPWARDSWGFNPEAQWFANRGYLCVQVNYRGSTGYGKDFTNAGNKEWGGRMHDDLIDAVEHVVGQGFADRERIAIYGGSYGGYAALVGATFTPDVFRCAVDIVGVANIKTWIEGVPAYWKPMLDMLHVRVGDPETEEDFLWSRSPLSKVDQIKVPMLIAQGANDPRVPQAESEQIVAAMKDKGIAHEYMVFEDEGHGFAKPENRLKFYAAAEKFLAEHLGGRAES